MASFSRFADKSRLVRNSASLLLSLFPQGSQWFDSEGSRVASNYLIKSDDASNVVWC